jgi:hypothetical protein
MASPNSRNYEESSQESAWFHSLIHFAQNEDWEALASRLSNYGTAGASSTLEVGAQLWEFVLCSTGSKSGINVDVALELIAAMIRHWGAGIVEITIDGNGQTPLHLATIQTCHPRVLHALTNVAPHCAHFLDDTQRRPVDHLSQKIVMMEERAKYHQHNHRDRSRINQSRPYHASQNNPLLEEGMEREEELMNNLWECVRILAIALGTEEEGEQLAGRPIFHACLLARDFPTALMERVLRRYPEQLQLTDANGNLPLHLIAARRRIPSNNDNTSTTERVDDNDYDDLELQAKILSLYPDAAQRRNHLGQCPMDVAIASGHGWSHGVRLLLQAFPEALVGRDDILLEHYPMILSRFMQNDDKNAVGTFLMYSLLRATPALFQR